MSHSTGTGTKKYTKEEMSSPGPNVSQKAAIGEKDPMCSPVLVDTVDQRYTERAIVSSSCVGRGANSQAHTMDVHCVLENLQRISSTC